MKGQGDSSKVEFIGGGKAEMVDHVLGGGGGLWGGGLISIEGVFDLCFGKRGGGAGTII